MPDNLSMRCRITPAATAGLASIRKWDDLGDLFKIGDIFSDHTRLYRSLHFGDSDYARAISEVLTSVEQRDPALIEGIAEHLQLSTWLKANDPAVHQQLYGSAFGALVGVTTASVNSSFDVTRAITRLEQALTSDPELALGSAKELLESVLKLILQAHGDTNLTDDMPQLLKRVQQYLALDPKVALAPSAAGQDTLKQVLAGVSQIVRGLAELRNLYGTGHGGVGPSPLELRHAHLAVTTAGAAATFLMETHEAQQAGARGALP
ncbi:abortive infection family protein [Deinococcus sp. JMULE3]|uniref:abortive infection family protein n=1 Tax=Deinococcus sp. JMULE3 TaxID=2518341 RepID=UPI00157523C6